MATAEPRSTPSPPAGTLADVQQMYEAARHAIGEYRLSDAMQQLDEAEQLLARSGDGADPRTVELGIRIRLSRSWGTESTAGVQPALVELDQLAGEARTLHRVDLVVLIAMQAAVLLARHGDLDRAMQRLIAAEPDSDQLHPHDLVRFLVNKGVMASQLQLWQTAADDLEQAADLARQHQLDQFEFMARHNLGFVEYLRGDLPRALAWMTQADRMSVEVSRDVSRLDIARVLLEAGLVIDASDLLRRLTDSLDDDTLANERSEALLDRARCELLLGRPRAAAELARQVAARANRRGESIRAMRAELMGLEALAIVPASGSAGEDRSARRETAERLTSRAMEIDQLEIAHRAQAMVAEVALTEGDLQGARRAVNRAKTLENSPQLATRSLIRQLRFRLEVAAQRHRAADQIATAAAQDLARAQAGVSNLDVRTALALHGVRLVDADISRAVRDRQPWRALVVSERWRHALITVPSVRPPTDADTAELWSRLRSLHQDLRMSEDPHRFSELRRAADAVEQSIRTRSWAELRSTVVHHDDPLTRSEVDQALHQQASTVVSYVWANNDLYGLVLRPGQPAHVLRIGPRKLVQATADRATRDLRALSHAPAVLSHTVESGLRESLLELDKALLGHLKGTPDDLVVVPTTALTGLPWAMLPSRRGRPVTVARSVTDWVRDSTTLTGPVRVASVSGGDLPLADREAVRICSIWPEAHLLPSTPDRVRAALGDVDLLHIAAHGSHRGDNPLFSSVRLSGGELFAHELEGDPLQASQVVLAACGAGNTTLRPGDEPLGLTASLLAFGVGTVIAPVSDVPDEQAHQAMTDYHAELVKGTDAATALARSTADGPLIARSFTCFGAPWRSGGATGSAID